MVLVGCSDIASLVSGSCDGSQTVAGMTVQLCSEAPNGSVSQQSTLNTLCRSGQLGSAAGSWQQGVSCTTTGRIGGCERTTDGISVTSWVYPGATAVNTAAVQAFCTSIQGTYVAP